MTFDAIDHVLLPVGSAADTAPFERLGIALSEATAVRGLPLDRRRFTVGSGVNRFEVRLLPAPLPEGSETSSTAELLRPIAIEAGRLTAVGLRVADIDAALAAVQERGLTPPALGVRELRDSENNLVAKAALLQTANDGAVNLMVIQHLVPPQPAATGALPLKRLDHLAAMTASLEAATHFWVETLGVPLYGEVRSPAIIIRQFKIGDAILELLGPSSPDSPAAGRPAGLASMIACEVDDLEAAVAHARAAGFSPPDPATGVLPGTRVSTIPGTELAGLGLQLITYR